MEQMEEERMKIRKANVAIPVFCYNVGRYLNVYLSVQSVVVVIVTRFQIKYSLYNS